MFYSGRTITLRHLIGPPPPPNCPRDSSPGDDGQCHCDGGTHGKPGRCVPDQPTPPNCPRDSSPDDNGQCQCDDGTHGKPGRCVPDQPAQRDEFDTRIVPLAA